MNQSEHNQDHIDQVFLYALQVLSFTEISTIEAQIASCRACREELEMIRPLIALFVGCDADVLRPPESIWDRVSERISRDTEAQRPFVSSTKPLPRPEWEQAAPGIHVKILSSDGDKKQISMLVRLDPGTDYPRHTHAGVEELHLLHGVLKVDDRTLYPGDFAHAEAGSKDHRVWSETGCTCFLMTSIEDALF